MKPVRLFPKLVGWLVCLIIGLAAADLQAQRSEAVTQPGLPSAAASRLSDLSAKPSVADSQPVWTATQVGDTVVSFAIFMPGPEIYELEGHAALRLQMPQGDFAVSFGTFDFNQPNFVYRFVKGETDYWATIAPWLPFADSYYRQNRRIYCLRLNLTPEQCRRVVERVGWYMLPQNRTYRYNYVKDNCATRPLDIIRYAVGNSLKLSAPAGYDQFDLHSFRAVMRHYHSNYPWYQFGIDLALGSGIDYTITPDEQAFAPALLLDQLREATIGNRPLVAEETAFIPPESDSDTSAVLSATPALLTPLACAVYILLLIMLATVRDWRRRRVTRWVDALLFGVFGLCGCLLTFLIFISEHEATSPNWLYLWLNPLNLIVPVFIWIKKLKNVVFCYQIANFAVVFAMAVSWYWIPQTGNIAFVPLILCDLIRSASYIFLSSNLNHKAPSKLS